jgi:hypothetical protein
MGVLGMTSIDEVAFQNTADQFELTDEERQDPRMAKLVRNTTVFALWTVIESMRRFGEALRGVKPPDEPTNPPGDPQTSQD